MFSKGYTEKQPNQIFVIDSVVKTNLWVYIIKHLNREKITWSFYENELLFSRLLISCYPSQIKSK